MTRAKTLLGVVALIGLTAVLFGSLAPDAGAKPTPTTEAPPPTVVPTSIPCDPGECPVVPCEPAGYDDCVPPTTVRPPNCFDVVPLGPGCIPEPTVPTLIPPIGCSLSGPGLGDDVEVVCPEEPTEPVAGTPVVTG